MGLGYHHLSLKSNGQVWTWGRNNAGQLGDNTTASKSSPVLVVGNHYFSTLSEILDVPDEKILLSPGGYAELETWCLGIGTCEIDRDKYFNGAGNVTILYKEGDTQANCEADSWKEYIKPFYCSGWIKIRLEN